MPTIRPELRSHVQLSDHNLADRHKGDIFTSGSRGPNESSDLDQVHQKHFNEYFAENTPDHRHSGKTLLKQQESPEDDGDSNKYSPMWPDKLKPLEVLTRNRPPNQFATVQHNDSLIETPKPDRMLNSIMYSEVERRNSVQLPGDAGKPAKASLRAMKAHAEHEKLIEEVRANHFR